MAMATEGKGRTESGPGGHVADYTLTRLREWGLPPHIRLKQAKKMMQAMLADDPERAGVMVRAFKGKAAELKESLTRSSD